MRSTISRLNVAACIFVTLSSGAAKALDCTAAINRDIAGLGFEPFRIGSGVVQKGISSDAYKAKRIELEQEKKRKQASELAAFTSRTDALFKQMPAVKAEFEDLDELSRVKSEVLGSFEHRLDLKLQDEFEPKFAALEKEFGLDETRRTVLGWGTSFDRSVRLAKSKSSVEVFLSKNNGVSAYAVASTTGKKIVFLNEACEVKRIEVSRTANRDSDYFTLSARFCSDPENTKRLYELPSSRAKTFADACESTGGLHDGPDRRTGNCKCLDTRVLTSTSSPSHIALGCGSPVMSGSQSILLSRFPISKEGFKDAITICASQSGNFEVVPASIPAKAEEKKTIR